MTGRRCIFAWTRNEPDDPLYPDYVSLNREEDGRLILTVRAPRRPPHTDDNPNPFALEGRQASITLPDDVLYDLGACLETWEIDKHRIAAGAKG